MTAISNNPTPTTPVAQEAPKSDYKPKQTPLRQIGKAIKNSDVFQFAKDNVLLSVGTGAGVTIITGHAAMNSKPFLKVLEKGALPAAGAGVAALGGALIHDTLVNSATEKHGETWGTGIDGAKLIGGSMAGLMGVEMIGTAFNAKALKPLTLLGEEMGRGLLGAAAGATVAVMAAKNIGEEGVNIGNSLFLTAGAAAGAGMLSASIDEAFMYNKTAEVASKTASKAALTFLGAGLGLTAYAAAKKTGEAIKEDNLGASLGYGALTAASGAGSAAAIGQGLIGKGAATQIGIAAGLGLGAYKLGEVTGDAIKEGKSGKAVIAASLAATSGAASIVLLGEGTGIKAISNVGKEVFLKNPLLAGAIAATALGVGSYIIHQKSQDNKEAQEANQKPQLQAVETNEE